MSVLLICSLCCFTPNSVIQADDSIQNSRLQPVPITIKSPSTLMATFTYVNTDISDYRGATRGTCPSIPVALTDATFGDGSYIMQAGFAEEESFGATYSVPADEFPIKIDVIEALFATSNAGVQTTTEWSVTIWDGTPRDGIQVASFASDDVILPHLIMPPGSNGIVIQVTVDPNDPEQIYVYNDSGMNSYSVAFKIVKHNNQTSDPCLSAPPTYSNAFPCTDTSGLQFPQQNWINAVAGSWCFCGSGWMTFQEFPSLCTPSGDWVLRSSYTPTNCNIEPIACCFQDIDDCFDLSPGDCTLANGIPSATGTSCATFMCNSGAGACCIVSTGNCGFFDLGTCDIVGGIHYGEGTTCETIICFPEGACCLPNGGCDGAVTPEQCSTLNGIFQGDSTQCDDAICPQPTGACCGTSWCLDMTESDCTITGGAWHDATTMCGNGSICDSVCTEDLNNDGAVDVTDLLSVISEWGNQGSNADIDGNGTVDVGDLLVIISAWGACP